MVEARRLPAMPLAVIECLYTLDLQKDKCRVFQLKSAHDLIQIAQSKCERRETANEIANHLLMPLLFFLPCLGGLVCFGPGWSLRLLQDVVNSVNQRHPELLQAIPNERLLQEASSLVTALNGLLIRLDQVLNKQYQFIADAAHELRTPLTAVSLKEQIAELANALEKRSLAFSNLRQGIARASHVVKQLSVMARFNPETFHTINTPLRLDELIRTLLSEFMPLATERKLDLSLIVHETTPILGDAVTLHILFGSVLYNAIRYTPAGGRIEVSVLAKGDMGYLEADQHLATIILSDGKSGKCLNVNIFFPCCHES